MANLKEVVDNVLKISVGFNFHRDKLLEKNIQVIGLDSLTFKKRDNLRGASENKNFHLLFADIENIDLDLERLDYLFIAEKCADNLDKIFELIKKHKSRCLFISAIELYDRAILGGDLKWFKLTEEKIARLSSEFNLNARILRLGPVFGPRMNFEKSDPLINLIRQALNGDLQKDVSKT